MVVNSKEEVGGQGPMNEEEKRERERIQRIVMQAQKAQTKRTMKALGIFMIVYFAIQGAAAIYHYFF